MGLRETLAEALREHRLNAWYWPRFLRDNPNLGPAVLAYLDGSPARPAEALLGANHYARGLVLTEDGRRAAPAFPSPSLLPSETRP